MQISSLFLILSGISAVLIFDEAVAASGQEIAIRGVIRFHGEFELYPEKRTSLRSEIVGPRGCVSGVSAGNMHVYKGLDGKLVVVRGKLISYDSLSSERYPHMAIGKSYAGNTVPNYCLGTRVLIARSIKESTRRTRRAQP